jgi:hypothetical protein
MKLRERIAPHSGDAQPFRCLRPVLCDPLAFGVHGGNHDLSAYVPLLGGTAVPLRRFGVVAAHVNPGDKLDSGIGQVV